MLGVGGPWKTSDGLFPSHGGRQEVSATARHDGLSRSQPFTWRRLAREGRFGHEVPALVPVEIAAPAANSPAPRYPDLLRRYTPTE